MPWHSLLGLAVSLPPRRGFVLLLPSRFATGQKFHGEVVLNNGLIEVSHIVSDFMGAQTIFRFGISCHLVSETLC